jgi:hypothetical protein
MSPAVFTDRFSFEEELREQVERARLDCMLAALVEPAGEEKRRAMDGLTRAVQRLSDCVIRDA